MSTSACNALADIRSRWDETGPATAATATAATATATATAATATATATAATATATGATTTATATAGPATATGATTAAATATGATATRASATRAVLLAGCGWKPGQREIPHSADAGVDDDVTSDVPVRESFEELYPVFMLRKVDQREKAVFWTRYRNRWVRWRGRLVSFTDNGATFLLRPETSTFDVSVGFEAEARPRLRQYRVGDMVTFIGRLNSYDDLWRTIYLVHGDLAPLVLDGGSAPRAP